MRKQFFALTAALVLTAVGQTQVASSLELGRYTALTMRQYLHDDVCIALSDGQISGSERTRLLAHAKKILKAEEYEAFRQSLDRASPPKAVVKKRTSSAIENTVTAAKQKPPMTAKQTAPRSVRPSPQFVDRMDGPLLWRAQNPQAGSPRTASRGSWAKPAPSKSAKSKEIVVSDKVVSRSVVR